MKGSSDLGRLGKPGGRLNKKFTGNCKILRCMDLIYFFIITIGLSFRYGWSHLYFTG